MAGSYQIQPVEVTPGVAPISDFTPQSITQFTFSDKVRFINGFPEKIGGWKNLLLSGNYAINTLPRSIYSYLLGNIIYYLVGTYRSLYMLQGNTLFNATPLKDSGDTLNDVLSSVYDTLGTDPFSVTEGVPLVTVVDTSH